MSAYYQPVTLDDALAVLARTGATVAAGCTDLYPATERQALPGDILDITSVDGLRGISTETDGWRIGATTRWADILAADLPPAFDMLKQAAAEVGSVQIQNAGTVAGNLCNASPAADGVPPLLALDAQIALASAVGRRKMPLADFLTGVRQTRRSPDELLTALFIPASSGVGESRFLKVGARAYLVISVAMVAVRLAHRDGRVTGSAVSIGACSPVATRLSALEDRLLGLHLRDVPAAVDRAVITPAIAPISDIRGGSDYRGRAATELVRRALTQLSRQP